MDKANLSVLGIISQLIYKDPLYPLQWRSQQFYQPLHPSRSQQSIATGTIRTSLQTCSLIGISGGCLPSGLHSLCTMLLERMKTPRRLHTPGHSQQLSPGLQALGDKDQHHFRVFSNGFSKTRNRTLLRSLPPGAVCQTVVLKQAWRCFSPRGRLTMCRDISGCHNRGTGSSAGIHGVEARDAAKRLPGHRTAPATKN